MAEGERKLIKLRVKKLGLECRVANVDKNYHVEEYKKDQ